MLRQASFLLALPLFACANVGQNTEDRAGEPQMANEQAAEGAVSDLPYSRGQSFSSLDEYLSYLERMNGPIDLPYWRRIGPDLFEQAVRMPGIDTPPERATREELEQRFGFTSS